MGSPGAFPASLTSSPHNYRSTEHSRRQGDVEGLAMAKTKSPRRSRRSRSTGRKRLTCWVSDEIHQRLTACAAHRRVKLGGPVEDALKEYLDGFYVVDPADRSRLAVADGTAAEGERVA